jgi:chromosome segregation ATPase
LVAERGRGALKPQGGQPEFVTDVIQSILFFALGFLTAGFLALLVAPAFWRRAVNLTRKRVEASVPMTLNEIQADKDRIRAEFAMSARRLEMGVEALRDKNAAQTIEIGRGREEIKALNSVIAEKNGAMAELESAGEALRAELHQRTDDLQRLSSKLADTDEAMQQRAAEIEKLGRMYDDASFSSSSRQIELVARESELEQLGSDAVRLKGKVEEADKRFQEREQEAATLRDAVKAEARKVDGLERKVAGMLSTIAEQEEKLELSTKDAARLREEVARAAMAENDLNARLVELQAEKSRLEARATETTAAMGDEPEKSAGRERLESRLTALTRENRKLKADLRTIKTAEGGDDILRERIGELAAQMVHLTSALEGRGSPIAKALESPASNAGQGGGKPSLADRVRALQKAAAPAG